MDVAALRAVALRVAALALLLLLALVATLSVRTVARLPDARLYLIHAAPTSFTLVPVVRRLGTRDLEAFARAAVAALAEGPTPEELADGLASAVPDDSQVVAARFDGGVLEVELSPSFASGGGSASMLGRLHQLRWTLTRPTRVEELRLRMDGRPLQALGGEGILVEPGWRRPADGEVPRW